MLDARRRRTPGRETEKPATGVNSSMEGGGQEDGEFRIENFELIEWWLPKGKFTSRMRWRIARKDTRRKTQDSRPKTEDG